ncbi:Putative ribonuclease H protein At1g65750 [Linum perenne]
MELLLNHARRLSISNQKPNLNLIPRTQSANERGSFMLVGKMITKRQISTSTMKGATRLPWGQEGEVDIRNEGDNIFVITFQTDHQREKVWKKRPWVIANTLLNLKRWDGDGDPKEVAFQTADLWIHIHNLPARYRSEENVKEISQYFVKFLECDRAGFEPGRWKRFIRLFAEVRIDDPLQITGELTSGGKDLVEFKYEKIQDYCLYCGRIGHSESSCDDREEDIRKGESGEIPGCFDFSIRAGTEPRKLNFAEGEDTQHRRLASSPSMGLGNTEEMITPERHVSRGNIGASNLNVTGGSGPNQISLVQAQGQEYTPTTEDIFGGKELEGGEKSRAEKAVRRGFHPRKLGDEMEDEEEEEGAATRNPKERGWKIGDGNGVRVWGDPWLRRDGGLRVASDVIAGLEDMRVRDLFIPGTREWDAELVEELLNEEEAAVVLSTPVVDVGERDTRIWHYTKNGQYTVRSSYHVLMERVANMEHLHTPGPWKELWQLKVPPKMRVMLWRLARDVLPTRVRLCRRRIWMNDSCGTCSKYPETSWHLFLHCEYAIECWRIVGLWGEVERLAATAESFQDWLFAALRDLPEMKMQMLVAVVGGLWIERNGRVWSTERKPAFVTIRGAMEAVREWQGTRRSESGPMLQPADTTCRKWHPPRRACLSAMWMAPCLEIKEGRVLGWC